MLLVSTSASLDDLPRGVSKTLISEALVTIYYYIHPFTIKIELNVTKRYPNKSNGCVCFCFLKQSCLLLRIRNNYPIHYGEFVPFLLVSWPQKNLNVTRDSSSLKFNGPFTIPRKGGIFTLGARENPECAVANYPSG